MFRKGLTRESREEKRDRNHGPLTCPTSRVETGDAKTGVKTRESRPVEGSSRVLLWDGPVELFSLPRYPRRSGGSWTGFVVGHSWNRGVTGVEVVDFLRRPGPPLVSTRSVPTRNTPIRRTHTVADHAGLHSTHPTGLRKLR